MKQKPIRVETETCIILWANRANPIFSKPMSNAKITLFAAMLIWCQIASDPLLTTTAIACQNLALNGYEL